MALRTNLCADEVVIITIDPRTGRLNLLDTGDLAAAGRGPRFTAISDRVNESPTILAEALVRLRINVSITCRRLRSAAKPILQTITELAEQKANYLGLQSYRFRNFSQAGMRYAMR